MESKAERATPAIDPPKGLVVRMGELQASFAEVRGQLEAVLAELRSRPAPVIDRPMSVARTFYSVEEVATMLGKSAYTVREWCRHGQVNATKRAERRGGGALWSVSAEEVARYRNEGLLPISPDRNNRN